MGAPNALKKAAAIEREASQREGKLFRAESDQYVEFMTVGLLAWMDAQADAVTAPIETVWGQLLDSGEGRRGEIIDAYLDTYWGQPARWDDIAGGIVRSTVERAFTYDGGREWRRAQQYYARYPQPREGWWEVGPSKIIRDGKDVLLFGASTELDADHPDLFLSSFDAAFRNSYLTADNQNRTAYIKHLFGEVLDDTTLQAVAGGGSVTPQIVMVTVPREAFFDYFRQDVLGQFSYRGGLPDQAFSRADAIDSWDRFVRWLLVPYDQSDTFKSISPRVQPLSTMFEDRSGTFTTFFGEADSAWGGSYGTYWQEIGLSETTRAKMESTMEDAAARGLPANQAARMLRDDLSGEFGLYRSTLIARTELTAGRNFAKYGVWQESGTVEEKRWSSAFDPRTRPWHADADGQVVGLAESFTVGGAQMEYPGDFAGGARNTCNCRCTMVPFRKTIDEADAGVYDVAEGFGDALGVGLENAQDEIEHWSDVLGENDNFDEVEETKDRIAETLLGRVADNPDWIDFLKTEMAEQFAASGAKIIGADAAFDEQAVVGMIHQWAVSSADTDELAIALQACAREEFAAEIHGVPLTSHFTLDIDKVFDVVKGQGADLGIRRFLREMYDETQEWLTKQGVDEYVIMYRGQHWGDLPESTAFKFALSETQTAYAGESGGLQLQPLSSFSTSLDTAKQFAAADDYHIVTAARVPKSRIIGTCQTGFGCKRETEMIVLGGTDDSRGLSWQRGLAGTPPPSTSTLKRELLGE